jgi:hypothetical protein
MYLCTILLPLKYYWLMRFFIDYHYSGPEYFNVITNGPTAVLTLNQNFSYQFINNLINNNLHRYTS